MGPSTSRLTKRFTNFDHVDTVTDYQSKELNMFESANLDDREKVIYADADQWWATRFMGRGVYDKLGPFSSAEETFKNIMIFFRQEERNYPPPEFVSKRPFAVYAASTQHNEAHVIVGNVYRDGVHRPTHREVSQKVQEARALVATKRKSSRRRNSPRPA